MSAPASMGGMTPARGDVGVALGGHLGGHVECINGAVGGAIDRSIGVQRPGMKQFFASQIYSARSSNRSLGQTSKRRLCRSIVAVKWLSSMSATTSSKEQRDGRRRSKDVLAVWAGGRHGGTRSDGTCRVVVRPGGEAPQSGDRKARRRQALHRLPDR